MKSKRETVRKYMDLPREIYFLMFFGGSFFPGLWGRAFASLAGMLLALYLLGLVRGKKGYILAVILPIVSCMIVRCVSSHVYRWITDVEARGALWRKISAIVDNAVHYGNRLFETALSLGGFVEFFRAWDAKSSFGPILANMQFVLIFVGMGVCLFSVMRKKGLD
jgi:hypothetical protein